MKRITHDQLMRRAKIIEILHSLPHGQKRISKSDDHYTQMITTLLWKQDWIPTDNQMEHMEEIRDRYSNPAEGKGKAVQK